MIKEKSVRQQIRELLESKDVLGFSLWRCKGRSHRHHLVLAWGSPPPAKCSGEHDYKFIVEIPKSSRVKRHLGANYED
jgi:hypothetical protein